VASRKSRGGAQTIPPPPKTDAQGGTVVSFKLMSVTFDLEQYPLFLNMPEPADTFQRWVRLNYSIFESQHRAQPSLKTEEMIDAVKGTCELLRATTEAEKERMREDMRTAASVQVKTMRDLETRLFDAAISTKDLLGSELRAVGSTTTSAVRELETRISGLFSKSQSLGVVGEKSLAAILAEDMPGKDWDVRPSGTEGRSGDYIVSYKGEFGCMLDAKNYARNVSKVEVEKLKRDMEHHNVQTGAIISLKSRVAGRSLDDMEVYTDSNGVRRCLAYLGNTSEHPRKVWLGIQWLRCVWTQLLRSNVDIVQSVQLDDRTARAFTEAMDAAKELHEIDYDLELVRTSLNKATDSLHTAQLRAADRAHRVQKKIADCLASLSRVQIT